MISNSGKKIRRFLVIALMMLVSPMISEASATAVVKQTCDAVADLALETGDYPTSITLHLKILQSEDNNARAHYHLGFSYGMLGRVADEIHEYRRAVTLGLKQWDIFMNLGLAYYDQHENHNATAALEAAVSLGSDHAETHFNLAVMYEKQNRLDEALQQIITALIIAPKDLEAANTDAIICAKMGDFVSARRIWTQLIQAAPDYVPARINLAILNSTCDVSASSCLNLQKPEFPLKTEREK